MQEAVASAYSRDSSAEEIARAVDLTGKLAVITGGAAGLGLETARALALAGADIFIAGRRPQVVAAAAQKLSETGQIVHSAVLDLMSVESVDAFADAVLALERPVDMLIANAGIMACPLQRTAKGIESQFMTNVVGHAVLLSRLARALAQSDDGRFVSLSSTAHHMSPVHFDDIQFERRPYEKWSAYGQSKTGNVLLAVKAAKALGPKGVSCFALHPGMIRTELSRSLDDSDLTQFSSTTAEGQPVADLFKDVPRGASTSVWAATSPALRGKGPLYLEDNKVAELLTKPARYHGVSAYALDPESADRLWTEIETIVERELPL
ncbi:SDR family NAD(P)-dependent oxidoreductase [Sphingobium sp. HBC34]|uniref:SDR family NAD(P)-dependent oxidoreductase n=1 Tax=Sphingobium cyanobacteriorum TaxID=3063954 RepID=A0ABT8ZPF4_9SPHN|nr:SDR family NAD(P)-dependent oxidoreductase [Sphingobium sp. HBC34]MDO7836414.1 SDR family NAD(P)-dependent oxidoreductase [Sphingobium sp. HBC34]